MDTLTYGKRAPTAGITPAVVLVNPRFPHNVGAAVRAAACFGVSQLWWTGNRVTLDVTKGERLPREERMKAYNDVELRHFDYPFDAFENAVPVAIEVRKNSEQLPQFEHPENAVYVFGPEDGGLGDPIVRHCHRFVMIPTLHCTNLAAAVYLVLYDRLVKRQAQGLEPILATESLLAENRGWTEPEVFTGR